MTALLVSLVALPVVVGLGATLGPSLAGCGGPSDEHPPPARPCTDPGCFGKPPIGGGGDGSIGDGSIGDGSGTDGTSEGGADGGGSDGSGDGGASDGTTTGDGGAGG